MKIVVLIACFVLIVKHSSAQTKPERTLAHSIVLDTSLTPDYYSVRIGVSEYLRLEGEGRKQTVILVPLDTVIVNLQKELHKLGFYQKLTKSSITEKVNRNGIESPYLYDKVLFQVSFDFVVSSKDSVEYLFAKMGKEKIQSLNVSPEFNKSRLNNIEELLISQGLSLIKKHAQKILEENNQQIVKQTNTIISFSPKMLNNQLMYNIYGEQKDFVINLGNVDYVLNLYCTFSLEDK